MTRMAADVATVGGTHLKGHNHSVWHKLWHAVLEPQTPMIEDEIIEYLHRYRHDLPPEVWIELERCA